MSNYIFKVGDKVEWNGMFGTVRDISDSDGDDGYPLRVDFKSIHEYFTADGRFNEEQTTPVLKLVEKAKTKVKMYLYAYKINPTSRWRTSEVYFKDDSDFNEHYSNFKIYFKLENTMIEVEE